MRRDTQHLLLVLLGGAMVRLGTGEVFLRYVRPGHRWLLIGAGAVIVALAVVAFVRDLRVAPAADGTGDHDDDHAHGDARYTPWLLLAPVLAVALVAPPALGADAVDRTGAGNAVSATDLLPPLPPSLPGDAVPLGVAEFVQRAIGGAAGSLEGREVTLSGFVVRRGAAVDLARMTIVCCAADARPHRVRLVGDLDGVPDGEAGVDTWLSVRGSLVPGSGTPVDGYVPALTVRSAEVVAEPTDPYE